MNQRRAQIRGFGLHYSLFIEFTGVGFLRMWVSSCGSALGSGAPKCGKEQDLALFSGIVAKSGSAAWASYVQSHFLFGNTQLLSAFGTSHNVPLRSTLRRLKAGITGRMFLPLPLKFMLLEKLAAGRTKSINPVNFI